MGLLDDAIREHLELKRRHGADPAEVAELEREAFGPGRRAPEPLEVPPTAADAETASEPAPVPAPEAAAEPVDPVLIEPEVDPPVYEPPPEPAPAEPVPDPAIEPEPAAASEPPLPSEPPGEGEEDVLEETPEFLQETPEHDRLWFEQRPPRDFDFDG